MDDAEKWRPIDVALAVAAAAIVAYGVLVLGWSVFVVIALFWFENVVIGVLNVFKIFIGGARLGLLGVIGALALAAFFSFHYGLFTLVHGVFVVALFGRNEIGPVSGLLAPVARMLGYLFAERDAGLAAGAIVVLQAASFVRWCGVASATANPFSEMFAPYGRVVILHATVLIGGLLVSTLGAPVFGALLLIGLKLWFDIVAARPALAGRWRMQGIRMDRFKMAPDDDARRP